MFNQISHGLSQHDIIFGSCACNKKCSANEERLGRFYSSIDEDALFGDCCTSDWNPIFNTTDVNEKVEHFNSVIMSLLNHHAPLRPYKKKSSLSSIKPWFTDEIKRSIIERDLAYAAYKNGIVPRLHYTQLRNAATSLIKRAKSDYLKPKLDSRLGSKAIWRNLKSIGVVSSSNVKPGFTADEYNKHITPQDTRTADRPATHTVNDSSGQFEFAFRNATSAEVAKVINSIKSKAIGLDGIPTVFVKMVLPFVLPVLTHIINHCFTASATPSSWKSAKVRHQTHYTST